MPLNSENLNLARSLDLSTTNRVLVDSISASNPIDTYRLTVSRSSDLKLSLQGVKANADIQVIQDANGNGRIDDREVLTSSALKGVGLDSINVSLAAGTYFVQAYAGDKGATTGYTLNYSATALGNPDSADLTATRSYFGTGVIRSFYNSRGISTYQNPSSTVVAFGSAQGQPNIFLMYGAIADYYTNNYTKNPSATNGLNGVASGLGNPTSAIYEQADGSSVMDFEGGQLVNRGGVVTPIYSKRGGDRFDLVGQGAPNGTELQWKDDYAWFGRDSVGQATGAVRRISNGYIQEFTGSKDGDSIFLLKDSQQVIGGVEQYKDDNGKLINTPKGGPYRVQGGVLQAYRSVGGAERVDGLGFATFSTERANFKGYKVYQEFENGFIAITKDNQVLIRDRQGQPILPPSPDYAGNTLQAAKSINIGALATYQDFVGTADTNDYYKFTIFSKSSINASLSNLSADANLQLLNSAGTVIGSSNNPGSASEEIYRSLDAGTYYIRAYQASGNTNYNLNIFASQITQTGDVISVRGSDGNLNVFAVGKDDKVWLWKQSDNNYTWWHDMGFTAQNIQVIQGGDGKLHVLGVGKDASTWMWNESDNNYTWWHNMGFGAQNVQATVGGDGKLHVLGVGKDASTWMWNESDNNYTWWHNMGFGAQNVQATVGGDGKLHVLGVGKDASTWMWNESDNNYTWWHNMG
ncbi:pre-peptidase C-terminal domain-containing protein, partial [Nostoc sp.]|uniref:pre-peptidase C-terminal domain-containing protein n=1 Tax=Nostoc sp. TaxID=1180 RepID=UPI002FF696FF